jgi:peptide/nickel transport system permease protein
MDTQVSEVKTSLATTENILAQSEQRNVWREVQRLLTHNRKVALGVSIMAIFILVAIFGPIFIRNDPNAFTDDIMVAPSAQHLLGTTLTGQDVFTQLIVGTRASILWGFVTSLLVTIIATIIGLISGYFGGVIDDTITLIVNVFLVLPGLVLAIIIAAFFPIKGPLTVALVLTITSWAWGARVLRAQTMSMRSRDFVEAARSNGEHTLRILFFEILPNQIAIVAANFVGTTVYVIGAAAGLEFLGLGDPTSVNWGTMLYWAQNSSSILNGAWWWVLPPGLCLALVGTSLTLINYGIDEIANPRLRSESGAKLLKRAKKAV